MKTAVNPREWSGNSQGLTWGARKSLVVGTCQGWSFVVKHSQALTAAGRQVTILPLMRTNRNFMYSFIFE
ncbi:hypothetical protein [Dyadobacter sp. LHD-138]|uniref:hypothetical protein n=1 Tax=Dyadobacter sp. LHD-138 TaxID=3071413 RepID=UPI0027E0F4D1|nr:hypothetical protein [Dyadobacter sp. LHD-138]MDQ6481737.1 hypothetical protein [Dyadobacter sp. LHD-138]